MGAIASMPSPSGALEGVLDAVPEALIATDHEGVIVYMNRAADDLFGSASGAFVGASMENLLAESSRAGYRTHRRSFVADPSEADPGFECIGLTAMGREIPIDGTVGHYEIHGRPCILMGIREVSDRVATQRRLERRIAIETLAVRLSGRLNAAPDDEVDVAVQDALGDIGTFIGADRSYVLRFAPDGETVCASHEWSASVAGPPVAVVADGPDEAMRWLVDRIRQRHVVSLAATDDLGEHVQEGRRHLELRGVTSLVAVPMAGAGEVIGALVFETIQDSMMHRRPDEISALVMFQDYLANALSRKSAAEELRRANRILHAVSECTDALIRAEDEDQLLRDVCRIVVEAGGYRSAWVGVGMTDEDRSSRPLATWGDDRHLRSLSLSWAEDRRGGTGPAAVTVRTGAPVIVQNIETDPAFPDTGRPSALRHGYRSVVSVPFAYSAEKRGVLTVYATEPSAFDLPEVETLERFAGELAFGIEALRTRELERQARNELQSLLESKDEFIATIAHELRTPLTGVVGFAQILGDRGLDIGVDERVDMMRMLLEQSLDLTNIVDDLLVAAKAEAGRLNVAQVPVDLRCEAAQVVGSTGLERLQGVRVDGPSAPTIGDPARVRQIIRNLVTNAHRYGGPHIRIMSEYDGASSSVSVIDDGPGVAPSEEETIFEPYHRAHDAPGLTASMGLGLTISRRLAQLLGGDLTYARHDGRTIFKLALPGVAATGTEDAD